MPLRRGLLTALVTVAVVLVAGFALKAPCLYHPWGATEQFQYQTYCYSDVVALYYEHGLANDTVPYLERPNEYPVLGAFTAWTVAALTDTMQGYFFVSAMILITAAFGATLALWRSGIGVPRILGWTASPAVIAHAFTNWDLLAVAFATIGWMRWREGDAFQASLFFGLGGAAKLYPAFFLPFLLIGALRARDRRRVRRVVLGGFVGFGVPNLIVMAVAFDNWVGMWRFHLTGQGSRESPWALLEAMRLPPEVTGWAVVAILAAALVALAGLAWMRGIDPLVAGGLLTLTFLLATRFYSPQFTLWAIPILVALHVPWGRLVGFTLADVAVFLVRYQYFKTPEGQEPGSVDEAWAPWLAAASGLRWLLLAACAWWIARAYGRARHDEPGSGLGDERGADDLWTGPHPEA